jgi:hypothetical protein
MIVASGGIHRLISMLNSIRLPRRADQVARFKTRWSWVKRRSVANPVAHEAAVTVRAPRSIEANRLTWPSTASTDQRTSQQMLEMPHQQTLRTYCLLSILGVRMVLAPFTFGYANATVQPSGGRKVWL